MDKNLNSDQPQALVIHATALAPVRSPLKVGLLEGVSSAVGNLALFAGIDVAWQYLTGFSFREDVAGRSTRINTMLDEMSNSGVGINNKLTMLINKNTMSSPTGEVRNPIKSDT